MGSREWIQLLKCPDAFGIARMRSRDARARLDFGHGHARRRSIFHSAARPPGRPRFHNIRRPMPQLWIADERCTE